MNAPLFSLGTALSVLMIASARSDAVSVASGPPMSDIRPDLVVDDDSTRFGLTSLDPARIHSHECDIFVLNRLLSRLEDHRLSPATTYAQQTCIRTNIPIAAFLIE